MVSINFVCYANVCLSFLLITLSICTEFKSVNAFSKKGFLGRIHHQHSLDSDSDPAPQRAIMNEHSKLLRFLGDTPRTMFINTLSVVSSIFTIWGFIETRDDMIEMKKMKEEEEANESDQTGQLEELNQKLEGIRSGITDEIENLTHSFKQLICRFDAVHAKSHSVSQECLKFIRSLNKPTLSITDPSEAKHPHYKTNYIEKTNALSTHWNQHVGYVSGFSSLNE